MSAVLAVLRNPSAKKPYEDLVSTYLNLGMHENAEHLKFLINKRFGGAIADRSDLDEGQRKDSGQNP